MKKLYFILSILCVVVWSCKTVKKSAENNIEKKEEVVDMHTSQNSLDWNGTYQGTMPCADCPGIKTVLTLTLDLEFTKQIQYLERGDSIFTDKGSFVWDKSGQIITLKDKATEQYFVGENRLWKLDDKGNKITGLLAEDYILQKVFPAITDRHWALIELNGNAVEYDTLKGNQPYFILRPDEKNILYGNSGCNILRGKYELHGNNKILLLNMISTKRACPMLRIERAFLTALRRIKTYEVFDNYLTLFDENNNALAKFKMQYFD